MRTLVHKNQNRADLQKNQIDHLAEFLDIDIAALDAMTVEEQLELFRKIIAISQLKLTRLAMRN